MDIFYDRYDLMQLQIAVMIAGLVSFRITPPEESGDQ
jgi:hypothetical protein